VRRPAPGDATVPTAPLCGCWQRWQRDDGRHHAVRFPSSVGRPTRRLTRTRPRARCVHRGATFGESHPSTTIPGANKPGLVVLNRTGAAGCITHVWVTGGGGTGGDVRFSFYVDGEAEASVSYVMTLASASPSLATVGFTDTAAPWGNKRGRPPPPAHPTSFAAPPSGISPLLMTPRPCCRLRPRLDAGRLVQQHPHPFRLVDRRQGQRCRQ
jgi:hypothetical protein